MPADRNCSQQIAPILSENRTSCNEMFLEDLASAFRHYQRLGIDGSQLGSALGILKQAGIVE
jgi:hypothetical protein